MERWTHYKALQRLTGTLAFFTLAGCGTGLDTSVPTIPNLSYDSSSYVFEVGDTVNLEPHAQGFPASSCTATPSLLPSGLALGDSCRITGTALAAHATTAYSILPVNFMGNGPSVSLSLTVNAVVPPEVDADGDGVSEEEDCDDDDNSIYPGAADVCDGVDSDCGGEVENCRKTTYAGHTYIYVEAAADWATARADCSATYGGYLASITSAGENTAVSALAAGDEAWVGGNDLSTPLCWSWENGEPMGAYMNWGNLQPSPTANSGTEHCMHINSPWFPEWNDYICAEVRPGYICEVGSFTAAAGCYETDGDGDNYSGTSYNGDDCDDADAAISPGAPEDCSNTIDDDCDGTTDCGDLDCAGSAYCITCGDSICSAGEDVSNCYADCGSCGDTVCNAPEDGDNCYVDCGGCPNSFCETSETASSCYTDCGSCGDFSCDNPENASNCYSDCGSCGDFSCDGPEDRDNCYADCGVCGDSFCTAGSEDPTSCYTDCGYCGDTYCTGTEDAATCYVDCGSCGDTICNGPEHTLNCPVDCPGCGDSICNLAEDTNSCPEDCSICGDNVCDSLEDVNSCAVDCSVCGDAVCDGTENVATCYADCGSCGDNSCDAPEVCGDGNMSGGECNNDCGACSTCGNGFCDGSEDSGTCPADCSCGNWVCDITETNFTCPTDCGSGCGDGDCSAGEDIANCPYDCPADCGNGLCDGAESPTTCSQDCI